jgi:hypothetical protein
LSKKKKIVIGVVSTVLVLAYVIFTWGGVVFYNYHSFIGGGYSEFAEGLDGFVSVDSDYDEIGMIPIAHYFYTGRLPYSLALSMDDREKRYSLIHVSNIIVTYLDRKIAQKKLDFEEVFELHENYTYDEHGGSPKLHKLVMSIPDVVNRYMDCDIRLNGYLITVSGEQIGFSYFGRFEYEHRKGVTTFLEYIAGV